MTTPKAAQVVITDMNAKLNALLDDEREICGWDLEGLVNAYPSGRMVNRATPVDHSS